MKTSHKIAGLTVMVLALACYVMGGGTGSAAKMNRSTPNVTHIGQGEFTNEVGLSQQPVVVDFYATWCGPCRVLSPMLEKLAPGYTNRIKFVKVNVDESPDIAQKYQIEGMPTLLFFNKGEVTDRILGLPDEMVLMTKLDSFAAGK